MNRDPKSEALQINRLKYLLLITPFAYALSEVTQAAPAMQVGSIVLFFFAAELIVRRKHTANSREVRPAN